MAQRLRVEELLHAYRIGWFPMADPDGEIFWFEPKRRGVFELDRLNVPRSLRRTIAKNIFDVRFDTAFHAVIAGCAAREETWISREITDAYVELFERGDAHSVETFHGAQLVGGLYGVAIGGAFFGESMFSTMPDASKVALVALVDRLRVRGFTLLDTQWVTPHLQSLGAVEISREEYLRRLDLALALPCTFS